MSMPHAHAGASQKRDAALESDTHAGMLVAAGDLVAAAIGGSITVKRGYVFLFPLTCRVRAVVVDLTAELHWLSLRMCLCGACM